MLLLYYAEELCLAVVTEVLGIAAGAARMRHFRALQQPPDQA